MKDRADPEEVLIKLFGSISRARIIALLIDRQGQQLYQREIKVVAIHQGKIIFIGNTEADISHQVREERLEPMPLVFRVPREEDLQSIL